MVTCSDVTRYVLSLILLFHVFVSNTVDDEEEMLYGESNPLTSPMKEESSRGSASMTSAQTGKEQGAQNRQEPSHWSLLVRENGVMEVHTLIDRAPRLYVSA